MTTNMLRANNSKKRGRKCLIATARRRRKAVVIRKHKTTNTVHWKRTASIRSRRWISSGSREGGRMGDGGVIQDWEKGAALSPFAAFHSNPSALSSRGFFALYPQISHRRATVRFCPALFHRSDRSPPLSLFLYARMYICTNRLKLALEILDWLLVGEKKINEKESFNVK